MLIQNDQETRASAVNKDETPVVTGTDQVVTTLSIEENRAKPCSSNGNIGSRPVAKVPPVSTNGDNRNHDNEIPVVTETNQTTTPNSDNVNGQSNHNNKNKTPVIPEETNIALFIEVRM